MIKPENDGNGSKSQFSPLSWWFEGSETFFGNCVSFFLFYQNFLSRWDLQIWPLIFTYLLLPLKLTWAQKNVPKMDCGFSGSSWLLENHRTFRSNGQWCSCLGTTPLLPKTTRVLFNPMERQRIKWRFKQTAFNLTHKSFKSQYTVYTELKSPPSMWAQHCWLARLSLLPGALEGDWFVRWFSVLGKLLAVDGSLFSRGSWELSAGEAEMRKGRLRTVKFPSSSSRLRSSRSCCFGSWLFKHCLFRKIWLSLTLKLYYPAKHSLCWELVQWTISQSNLHTVFTILDLSVYICIYLIFFFKLTIFSFKQMYFKRKQLDMNVISMSSL